MKKNTIMLGVLLLVLIMVTITGYFVFEKKISKITGVHVDGTTYDSVTISWAPAKNAKKYKIYKTNDEGKEELIDTVEGTTYTDKGIKTGVDHLYTVVGSRGLINSKPSTPVKAGAKLDTPKLTVSTKKGLVNLSVDHVDGADGYLLYRDGKRIEEFHGDSFIDRTVTMGKTYDYTAIAYRGNRSRVYSAKGEPETVKLDFLGKLKGEIEEEDLILKWKKSKKYKKYLVYSGDKKLGEAKKNKYKIKNVRKDKTFDFKVVGINSEAEEGPELTRSMKLTSVPMTNKDALEGACEWAVKIAEDDTFTYGTGSRAHRFGCYFCNTNIKKKGASLVDGHSYKKTYCCNPFVSSAFAHGAGDPNMLAACQRATGVGMSERSYTRYGNWKKMSVASRKRGDVLVKSSHVVLYLGDNTIVHAASEGWGENSIRIDKVKDSYFNKYSFVMRYTGKGRGTKFGVKYL